MTDLLRAVVSKRSENTTVSLRVFRGPSIKCHCSLIIYYILVPALYVLSLSIQGQWTVLKSLSATV